jgi:sulfate adenylyltransferase
MTTPTELIAPYCGTLVNLVADPEGAQRLKDHAQRLPSLQLSERAVCDLELL